MKKVVICQYRLLHYRVRLFDLMRQACAERGIELCLVHGQPTRREASKRDLGQLDWATPVRNRYVEIGQRDVLWQPFPAQHRDASLVVLMQESRLLSNYPWLWGRNGTRARVAYWGHGRNFQSSSPHGLRERWKKSLVGRVDWWFAYTQMTRDILLRDGYPETRITVLDNAIDNQAFKQDLDSVSAHEVAALKKQYGIADSAKIGLFCGSLYPDKRLGLLVEAADKIQSIMPTFQLAIIGEGPSAAELELAAATRPWIIRLGVKNGREKARWFKAADVILNPGLVGLHVLDAFCSGKPMISTLDAKHSPEIAYLENGCNGVLTAGTPDDYARAVLDLLADDAAYATLAEAGLVASNRYTLDNMVKNFVSGVADCLAVSS